MESPSTQLSEPQLPAFRPGKKRKIHYRHRSGDEDDNSPPLDAQPSTAAAAALSPPPADPREPPTSAPDADADAADSAAEEGRSAVSEALRLRHARRARLGGVAFRAGPTPRGDADAEGEAGQGLVLHDGGTAGNQVAVGAISKRFAPQTGLVGELVNKHM